MSATLKSLSEPKLIKVLQSGSVGVIPTDTVYGLVCLANNEAAVKRLYGLKERQSKPGTLIAANIDQLVELGFKRRYLMAVEQFWPGAVSVVVPHGGIDTAYLRQGLPDLAVRIPADKKILNLLSKTGPLLTTSANLPGHEQSKTSQEAQTFFGDKLDFYVDGGDLTNRQASTIIRVVDDAVEVLREGAVKIDNNGVVK